MTAALAVLLAVLAAALGLPHSTNTAVPTPIGVGLRYTLAPGPPRAGLRDPCLAGRTARFATHVELFARGRAMLLPVGIGSAPGCRHSVWTSEPTGVIHVGAGTRDFGPVVCDLGTTTHVASAGGIPLPAAGARVPGWPAGRGVTRAACVLRPHGEVVVELGRYIPPHRFYLFPEGT